MGAIKITGLLSRGLRKNFNNGLKLLFPYLMDKYRDKKTQMQDELNSAFSFFFYSITIDEVVYDLDKALTDKNATLKFQTLRIIEKQANKQKSRALQEKMDNALRQLTPKIKVLIEDSDPKVREKAWQTLGRVKSALIDQGDLFVEFNAVKMQKLNQFADDSQQSEKIKFEDTKRINPQD
eukprot:TRINITY_DN4711_c0_g1_i2.p1 TRINITY_DN4711_c0_g1~~TRINITY_DN4711_c0_g1_i2.p1  ORF type:complete len:180 (+),score=18.34 TRINITY_DN4711_c0_g1_i2:780-1319(+)